jgi:predicted anti-sigma-YlaC factor YlaD
MNCKTVLNQLSSYLDDECKDNTHREINEHLEKCLNCRKEWDLMIRMAEEIRGLPTIVPEKNFTLSIMTKINAQKRIKSLPLPSIIYSFVFILFFFLGILLFKNTGPSATQEIRNPTMVQLLMESQQLNKLAIEEKTKQLLYEKENNENQ